MKPELVNFIKNFGVSKNIEKNEFILLYKSALEKNFEKSDTLKKMNKRIGIRKRRDKLKLNYQTNILMNCLRKYNNIETLTFDKEYYDFIKSIKGQEIENEFVLSFDEKKEILELENKKRRFELYKQTKDIKIIDKLIEEIKKGSKRKIEVKTTSNQLKCKNCGNDTDLIIDGGLYRCVECGVEGETVQKQGYLYAGNISGTAYVEGHEKMGLYIDEQLKSDHDKKMDKISNMIREYISLSDVTFDDQDLINTAWERLRNIKDKSLNNYKNETINIIVKLLRRKNVLNLTKELKELKNVFKIKISFIIKPQEIKDEITICLMKLLGPDDKKLIKQYKSIMNWENENFNKEKLAAIIKRIFVFKKYKITDITKYIKDCGLNNSKYNLFYNLIKTKIKTIEDLD